MLRSIVWLCGAVALGYLAYRFAAWRAFWQVSLVWFLILWVCVGGFLVAHGHRQSSNSARPTRFDQMRAAAAAERAQYVLQFGEDAAAQIDSNDPRFWSRMAAPKVSAK